jgi:molybdopterin synthase sulfur carrier subunit
MLVAPAIGQASLGGEKCPPECGHYTNWTWESGKLSEMKITVEIPSALRKFTDGVQTIECSSETLPDLLGEIEQRFPAISKHLRDDAGQVRRFVNIYVNEEDIRFLGGNTYKFREGDRVLVVPSIAGGTSADVRG